MQRKKSLGFELYGNDIDPLDLCPFLEVPEWLLVNLLEVLGKKEKPLTVVLRF